MLGIEYFQRCPVGCYAMSNKLRANASFSMMIMPVTRAIKPCARLATAKPTGMISPLAAAFCCNRNIFIAGRPHGIMISISSFFRAYYCISDVAPAALVTSAAFISLPSSYYHAMNLMPLPFSRYWRAPAGWCRRKVRQIYSYACAYMLSFLRRIADDVYYD